MRSVVKVLTYNKTCFYKIVKDKKCGSSAVAAGKV